MKLKLLFISLLAIGFAACSVQSKIVDSWKDPGTSIQNPSLHKIVVAALINDPGVRRQVEDYMVSLYPGQATQSYTLFGNGPLNGNEERYNELLKNQGFDGMVMMRQTNEQTSQHYVPGQMPEYYHTWNGYWHHGWGTSWYSPGTPGHMQTDRTWVVQVNAYSLLENKLVWSGTTSTTDPGGRVPLFEDVCKAVKKEMVKDGFLVKK